MINRRPITCSNERDGNQSFEFWTSRFDSYQVQGNSDNFRSYLWTAAYRRWLGDRRKKKPWKYQDSDIKARERWNDYTDAANEMFHRTGTDFAPWHLVSSEDKQYSRVAVLHIINANLRQCLD